MHLNEALAARVSRWRSDNYPSEQFPAIAEIKEDEARTEIANLRLQAIASLPKLAIFSDEAHESRLNYEANPERSYFDLLFGTLNQPPDDVEDIYFTGGTTDPQKTDFFVDFKGEDGQWHRYMPEFVIRRKDGKCLIVEIKKEHDRDHSIDRINGAKALATQKWVDLNPDRLKYQMIFVRQEEVAYEDVVNAYRLMDLSSPTNRKT